MAHGLLAHWIAMRRRKAWRRAHSRIAVLVILIGLVGLSGACSAAPATVAGGLVTRSLIVDGRARSYVVYLSPHAPRDRLPLVMVLHGQGGSAAQVLAPGHWQQGGGA